MGHLDFIEIIDTFVGCKRWFCESESVYLF